MILFWLICAVLVVIALAFILPPLIQRSDTNKKADERERRETNIAIYRDQLSELETDLRNGIISQEQHDQDREEIERRLLEDVKLSDTTKPTSSATGARSILYLLSIGLPLIAVLFYLKVGELKGLSQAQTEQRNVPEVANTRSQQQIEANVAALAERLKTNPSDSQGWIMLARSYNSMQRFGEAAGAYAKATELEPSNADLWAEYAFVSAMANDRKLEGQPMELVNKALKIDPENLKALQLAGNAAFQRKDYKQAIDYWSRVLKKVPPKSEVAESIQQRIDEAKSLSNTK
jgi:cytochrome c-type biogenesis protein CcmH